MAILCMDRGPQTDVTYLYKYLYGHEAVSSIIGKKSIPRKEKLVAQWKQVIFYRRKATNINKEVSSQENNASIINDKGMETSPEREIMSIKNRGMKYTTHLCSWRYSLGRLRRCRNRSTILFLPTPWFPTNSRCSPRAKSLDMSSRTRRCWSNKKK